MSSAVEPTRPPGAEPLNIGLKRKYQMFLRMTIDFEIIGEDSAGQDAD
jgi:hypothetical protein